jgi:hypothetical protein
MYSFLQVVKHDEPLSTGCDKGGNKPFVELVHHLQVHLGAPDNRKNIFLILSTTFRYILNMSCIDVAAAYYRLKHHNSFLPSTKSREKGKKN